MVRKIEPITKASQTKYRGNKSAAKQKKISISKADKSFSHYIRLRDADNYGIACCITCGKPYHWRNGDAGHFVTRGHYNTRFNEQNVHFQCKGCNNYKSGDQWNHGRMIDELYGSGTAERLMEEGRKPGKKPNKRQIEQIANKYKKMAEEIAYSKGIEFDVRA